MIYINGLVYCFIFDMLQQNYRADIPHNKTPMTRATPSDHPKLALGNSILGR